MKLRTRSGCHDIWSRAEGKRILEIGIDTGKNMPFHPVDAEIVALDISLKMLARVTKVAHRLQAGVRHELGGRPTQAASASR